MEGPLQFSPLFKCSEAPLGHFLLGGPRQGSLARAENELLSGSSGSIGEKFRIKLRKPAFSIRGSLPTHDRATNPSDGIPTAAVLEFHPLSFFHHRGD